MKNDHTGEHSTHTNKPEDRYQQLLGRRENFLLHAMVVVLSFLIFGSMPLVIYGFSFCKSDNRDLKIAAVAGSSLACIILLSVVKVHVQKPPKSYMKTMLYYVSIGLMTSGLSYAVGDLLKKVLVNLNSFDSNLDLTVPFLETNVVKSRWESYRNSGLTIQSSKVFSFSSSRLSREELCIESLLCFFLFANAQIEDFIYL